MEVLVLAALFLIYFRIECIMATVEEVQISLEALSAVVAATDVKLDEVRAFILSLQNGGGATPEQLQALLDLVNTVKGSADSVLAEADALDNA